MDGWDIYEDTLRSPYPSKLKCFGHKGILSYKVIHKDVVFCKDIEQIIKTLAKSTVQECAFMARVHQIFKRDSMYLQL